MPRLEIVLELEPTDVSDAGLRCWCCDAVACEWKTRLPTDPPGVSRGFHTRCKIAFDIGRSRTPSRMMQAVKP